MSRRSVRAYVAALATTALPGTMTVYPYIPKFADGSDAFAIRRMTSVEKRETIAANLMGPGRSKGMKKIIHTIEAEMFTEDPDEQVCSNAMDDLYEALVVGLRATALPVTLTDSQTGAQSTVVSIGEDVDVIDNQVSQAGEGESETLVWEEIVVSLTLTEMVQA